MSFSLCPHRKDFLSFCSHLPSIFITTIVSFSHPVILTNRSRVFSPSLPHFMSGNVTVRVCVPSCPSGILVVADYDILLRREEPVCFLFLCHPNREREIKESCCSP